MKWDAAALPRRAAQHRADRLLQALVRVGDDQPDALEPALHETPQERGPEGPILRRPDVDAENLAIPLARDAHRHDRGLADDAAIDPHLVVRRVDPQIAVLAGEGQRPKGGHDHVQLAADTRDLRFRDAVDARSFH